MTLRRRHSSISRHSSGASLVWFVTVILGIALIGCSGSPSTSPPPPQGASLGGTSTHAIHVFAKRPDGSKQRLDFGPATEGRSSGQAGQGLQDGNPPVLGTSAAGTAGQSIHILGFDAGGTQVPPPPTVDSPEHEFHATAWALVERAAAQCGDGTGTGVPVGDPWQPALGYPDPAWFVYLNEGTPLLGSCSGRLLTQQNLLCIADKLAEIGDAVGTVTWPARAPGATPPYVYGSDAGSAYGYAYEEWEIPLQSDSDRFIVRDLAIHTLALLATLDSFTDINPFTEATAPTCTTVWGEIAGGHAPVNQDLTSQMVFGINLANYPVFPPSNLMIQDSAGNHSATIARSALQIEAQILRSGGRLLHDLIRRDVYSDMAAEAQATARAMDPQAGNDIAWNSGPSAQGPYGTLAHAARVLLGRWEIGDVNSFPYFIADPKCEGVAELDLLSTFGTDRSARVSDLPIGTPAQAKAALLVEGAGIVLPSCAIPAGSSEGGVESTSRSLLGSALVDQLQMAQAGLANPLPRIFNERVVDGVTEADLAFAFRRATNTYLLLTNSSDNATVASCSPLAIPVSSADAGPGIAGALPGGLQASASVATSVRSAPLWGIVVAGGIARSRLTTDPMARAGGLLEASQCPETNSSWTEWGAPSTFSATKPSAPPYTLPRVDFQDAFHIGQALERRLVLLEAAANVPGITAAGSAATDPEAVARGAVAEIRTWAGSVIVHAWAQASTNGVSQRVNMQVRISGMKYGDLGLAPGMPVDAAVTNAFGFVYGPPWYAECAAHIRPDCPPGFDAAYVQRPLSPVADNSPPPSNPHTSAGVLDTVFQFSVPIDPSDPFKTALFNPPAVVIDAHGTAGESHLYMVRLHDPSSTGGHGYVLGTILLSGRTSIVGDRPTVNYDTVSLLDAPMQRELVHAALDLGKWAGARPPTLGDPSASETSGYCVDGVPRDLFVPLDNELTSGSATYEDSWQHYLDLAQQAAQTADTLGQALIADDLKISENQQAAGEQLASICGDFGSLSSATVQSNGTISAGQRDSATNTCIDEPITDVVFLGQLPTSIASIPKGQDATCAIKAAINCSLQDMQANGQSCSFSPPYKPAMTTPGTATQLCQKPQLSAAGLKKTSPPPPGGGGDTTATPAPLMSDLCSDLLTQVVPSVRTKFNAQRYLNDSYDATLSPAVLLTTANQLKMKIHFNNSWSVTFGTEKIMDTTDYHYWPTCMTSGCQKCVPGTTNPLCVSDAQAVMAPAWSSLFRDCPTPSDDFSANLDCDGPPGSGLNMIKWRVMQAMWMIGAMSGQIPQGMFKLPIPAVFANDCVGVTAHKCWNVYYPTGTVTMYTGALIDGSPSWCNNVACKTLDPNGPFTSTGDIRSLGPIYPIGNPFQAFENSGANEVPFWYRTIYSSNYPNAHHIWAENQAAIVNQCMAMGMSRGTNEFAPASSQCPGTGHGAGEGYPAPNAVQVNFSDLISSAIGLDNVQCTQNFGGPLLKATHPDPTNKDSWPSVVGNVKLGLAGGFEPHAGDLSGIPQFEGFPGPAASCPYTVGGAGDGENLDHGTARNFLATGMPEDPDTLHTGRGYVWDPSDVWYKDHSGGPPMEPPTMPVFNAEPAESDWYPGMGLSTPASCWPPSARALSFVGFGSAPNGTCGALTLLLQASALACTPMPTTVDIQSLSLQSVPPVNSLTDIPLLQAWLELAQQALNNALVGMYVQEIPARVVSDLQNGTVGSGSLAGTKGQAVLTIEQQLENIPSQWTQMTSDLGQIANAIRVANANIIAAGLKEKTTDGDLALQTIVVQGQMASATAQFLETTISAASNWTSFGLSTTVIPAAGMALSYAVATGNAQLAQFQSMATTASQTDQNQVTQALAALDTTTGPLWADVQKQLDGLRGTMAQIDASGQAIQQAQNEASYQLAIGTGADFATLPDGEKIPIPVNTVLRRQASGTERRYRTALTNAKALAYMARRAIEQRIGVPLDAITTPVGPLEAPHAWADDICSLQGVNYASLSTASLAPGTDGGALDNQAISQFADAWVGDYVAKLQGFVAYYNAQYPSHQGSDTAILSLRYDLLPGATQCETQGPNLLVNSGNLSEFSGPGWNLTSCDPTSTKCLAAAAGYALAAPSDGPWGAQATDDAGVSSLLGTGITLLIDVPRSSTLGGGGTAADAGAPEAGGDGGAPVGTPSTTAAWPSNLVAQQVQLAAGSYVLSWWDQARDPNGNLVYAVDAGGAIPHYEVKVFDASWHEVAVFDQTPYTPPQAGAGAAPVLWSDRRELAFPVAKAGTYAVAFSASEFAAGMGGVAVADVQLEQAANGKPTTYVATTDTTMVSGTNCPISESDLRSAFTHICDSAGNCYYQLNVPILIDTSALSDQSSMAAKLAAGNYNYRHVTSAVNVVGTGVHSCDNDPSPNCYGSAYIQYDWQHAAEAVGVVGYDGNARPFDFGIAAIRHGKALAAERYLTVPLSTSDQALVSQPGIAHEEFGGRPLDGTYYLRIWDSPDLNWSRLQDIQILLNYEYWSQIQTSQTSELRPPPKLDLGRGRRQPLVRR